MKSFRLQYTHDGLMLSSTVDKMGRLNLFLDVLNDFEAIIVGFGRYSGETICASRNTISLFGLEFKRASARCILKRLKRLKKPQIGDKSPERTLV